jgi:hypothetical protein
MLLLVAAAGAGAVGGFASGILASVLVRKLTLGDLVLHREEPSEFFAGSDRVVWERAP